MADYKFSAVNRDNSARRQMIKMIFSNMKSQASGQHNTSVLLAGDPGVGKTSFVRYFAKLMGFSLVVIEAPHITEEHIVSIPFLVFKPSDKLSDKGVTKVDTGKLSKEENDEGSYDIELSKSLLAAEIEHSPKITDQDYLEMVNNPDKFPKDVREMYELLGGTSDKIPTVIDQYRKSFKCILFLDEFYRQPSKNIRNILRGILDGMIGDDPIPDGTYVMYASNMKDAGIDSTIPLNHDFRQLKMEAPNKDEWFNYLVSKFESDKKYNVKLNPTVINKFYDVLSDEELNFNDVEHDVRTSPRRWEQLLLYINASLPATTQEDANELITNVEINFSDYLTGEKSKIAEKVIKAVNSLIKELSGGDLKYGSRSSVTEWRGTLAHQIKMKKKLGDARQYVPVISGPPGVGKSSYVASIAAEEDMIPVFVNVSVLNREDTTGIPVAKRDKDNRIETSFSEAKLYKLIMSSIRRSEKEFFNNITVDEREKFEKQDWKYLIFFDELNRTSVQVFNSLRRVILEKKFGTNHSLPKESIVVGAINPFDIGAEQFTGHMKDVMDIIPVQASWEKTTQFLEKLREQMKPKERAEIGANILNGIKAFAKRWKVRGNSGEDAEFHLNLGEAVWMSPREYTTLFTDTTNLIYDSFTEIIETIDLDDEEQLKAAERIIRRDLADSFATTVSFVLEKHNQDNPVFIDQLKEWIKTDEDFAVSEELFYKRNETFSFKEVVDDYFDSTDKTLADDMEFINFMEGANIQDFTEQVTDYLEEKISGDIDNFVELISKKPRKRVIINKETKALEQTSEDISKVEHFVNEILNAIFMNNFTGSGDRARYVATALIKACQKMHSKIKSEILDPIYIKMKDTGIDPESEDGKLYNIANKLKSEAVLMVRNISIRARKME
jgi:MoxR-like ATPase